MYGDGQIQSEWPEINPLNSLGFDLQIKHFFKLKNIDIFIVPRLFEEKWRDTVFGFPWGVVRGAWRMVRGAWRVVRGSEFLVGTLSP